MAPENVTLSDELAKLFLALRLGLATGVTPSVRELAQALGIAPGTVQKRMRELERLGVVERVPGRQRAIRIKGKVA